MPRDPLVQARSPARRFCGCRHARLGEQRVFHRRFSCGSHSFVSNCVSIVSPLEHLLRYCARPPFALERLSVTRDASGRIARVRYVLARHNAANWVGPGRGRKSTRPGANGVVELTPFEFLDRLARHVADCVGQAHGAGRGGVSARVPLGAAATSGWSRSNLRWLAFPKGTIVLA